MKRVRSDLRGRGVWGQLEWLESRVFLSATVAAQVPTQDITAGSSASPISLGSFFNDPEVTGTAVVLQTPLGNIPLVLTDGLTPATVANFLSYVESGAYANTVIHRSVPGFIIQGGGYDTSGTHIATHGDIAGEHQESNTIGTIAMGLLNGPNTAASEWFINLENNNGMDGNPNLDNSSDGGPFTAFGNVIYKGMSVVDAIAKLPVVDDSVPSGAFTNLPVLKGKNGSFVASEPADNLVTINPVIVPGGLTYSVASSNPGVVTASVNASGNLTLTGAVGGSAKITVTATDMGGGHVSTTFVVNVVSHSNTVTIGAGGAKSCTYTDASGATTTVSMSGAGSATLDFSGSDFAQVLTTKGVSMTGSSLRISSVATSGTTSASVLTVTSKGGTGAVDFGSVTTGALKSFSAGGVTLTGSLSASGTIGTLTIASATGGTVSAVSVGSVSVGGSFSDAVSLTGTGQSIGAFKAGSISGGTWTVAGGVGSLTVAGNFSGTVVAATLGKVTIDGAVSNSSFRLLGAGMDLSQFMVKGAVESSMLNAVGSIGAVSALALVDARIYAGVGTLSDQSMLPGATGDFSVNASIGSVKLTGTVSGESFSNSDIAAATLGALTLGVLQTNNGGAVEGVVGETLKSLSATANKAFSLKSSTSSSNITLVLSGDGVVLGNMVIELV